MMAARRTDAGPTLASLLDGLARVDARFERGVIALTMDSRQIGQGSLFFARRGTRMDATRFAPEALRAGACAMVEQGDGEAGLDARGLLRIPVADVDVAAGLVADRFFGEPSAAMPVIAVTGTNGKTSVCHFVARALEGLGRGPVGVLGTLGRGVGALLSDTGLTTPDSIAVHAALAQFRDAGATTTVMEASSHALEQQRMAGVRVDTAVFTNLSRDHLDYHGDMTAYARAKARLFASPDLRVALVNAADPAAGIMAEAVSGVAVTRFALDDADGSGSGATGCDLRGRLRACTAAGVVLEVTEAGVTSTIRSALLGATAAWNLLAAFGVLRAHDVGAADAAHALSVVEPAPGRMQTLGGNGFPLVVVDYAHSPAALAAAAGALAALCTGTLWCVFGAGGERDPGKRPMMGEAAARFAGRLVITDDNPRGEDPQHIVEDILAGIPVSARDTVAVERDRGRAIARAIAEATADDIVLVAGKGHETYQEVGARRRPFSDVAAVRAALEARRP